MAKIVSMAALSTKTFEATLERGGGRLHWTIVRIPFDVHKLWGKRGQIRVKGEIRRASNLAPAFAFRTSLFPTGHGSHYLVVNKRMQAGAKVAPGASAHFRITPDTIRRVVAVPRELERALNQDRALRRWFDALSHSTRHEIARWVGEAKGAETRLRRADQMAERLMLTMEAERGELPPVLQQTFARNPRAREGWQRMPLSHRRGHLLGIFYYRNPESQARRLQKAVDMMLEYATKQRTRAPANPIAL